MMGDEGNVAASVRGIERVGGALEDVRRTEEGRRSWVRIPWGRERTRPEGCTQRR